MDDDDPDGTPPLEIPLTDSIDLHTFRPQDVRSVVLEYLTEARSRGFRHVRIIHGRGIGVQREIVRSLLTEIPWVASYRDADPSGGGWGATLVFFAPVAD